MVQILKMFNQVGGGWGAPNLEEIISPYIYIFQSI